MAGQFDFRDMMGGADAKLEPNPAIAAESPEAEERLDREAERANTLATWLAAVALNNAQANGVLVGPTLGITMSVIAQAFATQAGTAARDEFVFQMRLALDGIEAGRL